MKTIPRILLLSFALPCAINFATAQTTTWTGAIDNDFNTAGNWDNSSPGNPTPTPVISADGADVTMSGSVTTQSTVISGNGTTAPKLTITEDYTNSFSAFQVGSDSSGSNFSGEVVHTSGTLTIGGSSGTRRLYIGHGASESTSGNLGTYTFGGISVSAPTIDVADEIQMGTRPGETGELFLQNFGTLSSGGRVDMGRFNGDATLDITGGNLSINLATGISAGTEGMTMARAGGGITSLNATIDSTGFSTINVGGDVRFGNSLTNNDSFFNLSLGSGFTPSVGSKYVIISASGAFTGGETFNNVGDGDIINTGGFDFEADYTGGEFSVTAIPEPGMAALFIGGAALAVLCARRRR